jgi:hypothetical protein
MTTEYFLVALVIGGAAFFLAWRAWRKLRGAASACACGECPAASVAKREKTCRRQIEEMREAQKDGKTPESGSE